MTEAVRVLGPGDWHSLRGAARAVTIGNFDGVHLGHRHLLNALARYAGGTGLTRCAVTFFPHPAAVVAPERAPRLLVSLAERVALLRRLGADEVVVLRFDAAFSRIAAEDFARLVLADALGAKHVVVGENFRFGSGQAGDTEALTALGRDLGFTVCGVPLATWRGLPVSSSEIRRQLAASNASRAMRLLGRPHFLEGAVVSGRGVGSRQTVPTLNLAGVAEAVPANGVYITRTLDPGAAAIYPSITNIGVRPTFADGHPERSIETFLLGPLVAQPERIRVEFLRRVRDERRFDSPAALREQIVQDAARAQAYHRRWLKCQPNALGSVSSLAAH